MNLEICKTRIIENKEYDPRMFIENEKYSPREYIKVRLFKTEKNTYFWGFLNCEVDSPQKNFEQQNVVKLGKLGDFKNEKIAIAHFRRELIRVKGHLRELM